MESWSAAVDAMVVATWRWLFGGATIDVEVSYQVAGAIFGSSTSAEMDPEWVWYPVTDQMKVTKTSLRVDLVVKGGKSFFIVFALRALKKVCVRAVSCWRSTSEA